MLKGSRDASASSLAAGSWRSYESGLCATTCVSAPARSGTRRARSNSTQG
jgi:hypothetical protein